MGIHDRFVRSSYDQNELIFGTIELTHRCNLRCLHCFVPRNFKNNASMELPTREVQRLLDTLSAMKCSYVTFTGGEVFLRNDFPDILDHASSKGLVIKILSNGTLIDEAVVRRLKKNAILSVYLSLYGENAGIHDRVSQEEGSFQKVLHSLRLLQDAGISGVAQLVVLNQTADHLPAMIEFCEKNRFLFQIGLKITPRMDGDTRTLDIAPTQEQIHALASCISRPEPGIPSNPSPTGPVPFPTDPCPAGRNQCTVSPEGEIFPCLLWRIPCGNVLNDDLAALWKESLILKKIREFRFPVNQECDGCGFFQNCERCPGYLHLIRDTLPDTPSCSLMRFNTSISAAF